MIKKSKNKIAYSPLFEGVASFIRTNVTTKLWNALKRHISEGNIKGVIFAFCLLL